MKQLNCSSKNKLCQTALLLNYEMCRTALLLKKDKETVSCSFIAQCKNRNSADSFIAQVKISATQLYC